MKSKAIVLAFSLASIAQSKSQFIAGSPASFLGRLDAENTRITRDYTFPTVSAELIKVDVEDFYFQGGYLSMVGRAKESRNSDFILKGGERSLYGWVVLRNRNIAFEYTTDESGAVVVEQVPVTKIFPICEFPDEVSIPADRKSVV